MTGDDPWYLGRVALDVFAIDRPNVRAADGGGAHREQYLTGAGVGVGQVPRSAWSCREGNTAHDVGSNACADVSGVTGSINMLS